MNEKNVLDMFQEDVVIPKIVQDKANEAFAKIRTEAEAGRISESVGADWKYAELGNEPGKVLAYTEIQKEPAKVPAYRRSRKQMAAAVLAAVLALGTVTAGAAVYLNWSNSLEEGLQVTPEQKDAAENSGLASFPEISVTDAGVTVTAQQCIVDNYYAYLSFKVEGYQVPEGKQPGFEYVNVTVDGEYVSYTSSFYNGLIMGEDGRAVRADGAEIPTDEDGVLNLDYTMKDGSLEYQIDLLSNGEKGSFFNKPIHVEFSGLGIYPEKAEDVQIEAEGTWSFDWTLTGDDAVYTAECAEALGDTGATVVSAEVSPISVRVVYDFPRQEFTEIGYRERQEIVDGETVQVSEPFEYTSYKEPPYLMGVKLKDGTLLPRVSAGGGMSGYMDKDSDQYVECFMTNRILDVDQVQSLLFLKEAPEGEGGILTEENLYVVDIR